MAKLTKSQNKVWDRLKNGIPKPLDENPAVNFNVDGTMMYLTNPNSSAPVMFTLSTPYDFRTASVWPPK